MFASLQKCAFLSSLCILLKCFVCALSSGCNVWDSAINHLTHCAFDICFLPNDVIRRGSQTAPTDIRRHLQRARKWSVQRELSVTEGCILRGRRKLPLCSCNLHTNHVLLCRRGGRRKEKTETGLMILAEPWHRNKNTSPIQKNLQQMLPVWIPFSDMEYIADFIILEKWRLSDIQSCVTFPATFIPTWQHIYGEREREQPNPSISII